MSDSYPTAIEHFQPNKSQWEKKQQQQQNRRRSGRGKCCGISIMPALPGEKAIELRDFPGGPVAKNLCFQCRGPGVLSLGS